MTYEEISAAFRVAKHTLGDFEAARIVAQYGDNGLASVIGENYGALSRALYRAMGTDRAKGETPPDSVEGFTVSAVARDLSAAREDRTKTLPISEQVARDVLDRAAFGRIKYGVTMDRTDLSRDQWFQHAYEESIDLANYLKRLMQVG